MKAGSVGCGFVGSAGAFTIALKGKANESMRVDLNADPAQTPKRGAEILKTAELDL
jgi:hypothetical protein